MDGAKIRLFDAHCHLESFGARGATYALLPEHFAVTSGYSHESNLENRKIRDGNPLQIGLTVGIAPQTAMKFPDIESVIPSWADSMMAAKPNAIGEIGLDFHWAKTEVEKQRQHAAFGYQRTLAKKAGLPVVIHCRDAMAEVLDELENNGFSDFMMHCFAGNADDAKRAVGLGGIISVPPMHSKERKKAIKAIGLENVVAETDAPYLGDTKTLSDINISIQIIADALGISFEKAAGATVENARRFYRI